jgi:hypothetical protein
LGATQNKLFLCTGAGKAEEPNNKAISLCKSYLE